MSKKHFQAVAEAFYQASRRQVALEGGNAEKAREFTGVISDLAEDMARVFAGLNPRFDRARFLEACETGTCRGMRKRVA